jgi:hypothetical protein
MGLTRAARRDGTHAAATQASGSKVSMFTRRR